MYKLRTTAQTRRRRIRAGVVAALCVVLLALCVLGYGRISASLKAQGAESLRSTILSSAVQCASLEGFYPPTLDYLEEHYGLTINHDDYVVNYEIFAENLMPSVTVVPR